MCVHVEVNYAITVCGLVNVVCYFLYLTIQNTFGVIFGNTSAMHTPSMHLFPPKRKNCTKRSSNSYCILHPNDDAMIQIESINLSVNT